MGRQAELYLPGAGRARHENEGPSSSILPNYLTCPHAAGTSHDAGAGSSSASLQYDYYPWVDQMVNRKIDFLLTYLIFWKILAHPSDTL
ncbi:hypothetical protein BQ8482_180366 [Mesorhizobium delmotii]|uniref:Uncharacterized protein n=1 Tax=Mesorhizobium delmotii TaxID=1631247 RepID=A0A2P9AJ35_9HYPH|nr:hypothetical protein BQ8482_180366 [Mesorhizobium delmotii]